MIFKSYLIAFASVLCLSQSAFADSAKMNVGLFHGQLTTSEEVHFTSVGFRAGFNFCAGFCSLGINNKITPIRAAAKASADGKTVAFKSLESPLVKGRSFLSTFRFCAVEMTVTGVEKSGKVFSATSIIGSSDAKGDCARGGATPIIFDPLILKSYVGNSGDRVYYIVNN